MKKLLTLMLALCLCASCLPALAEESAESPAHLSASGYMAALDAMAARAGVALLWHTEPFSGASGYTLHTCETLQGTPALVCQEDTVVMLCTAVTYSPEQAPLDSGAFLGQFLVMLTPILTSRGMTDEEALEALLPLVNESGLAEAAARVSAEDEEHHRFSILGCEAAILRYEEGGVTQLCLYIYTAPELMPRPQ